MIVIFFTITVFGYVMWFGINDVAMKEMAESDSDCSKAMSKLKDALTYLLILTSFGLLGAAYGIYGVSKGSDVFGIDDATSDHGIAFAMVVSIFCLVFGLMFYTSEACQDLQPDDKGNGQGIFLWMPITLFSIGGLALLYSVGCIYAAHMRSKGMGGGSDMGVMDDSGMEMADMGGGF
jgi:hypothetical protein